MPSRRLEILRSGAEFWLKSFGTKGQIKEWGGHPCGSCSLFFTGVEAYTFPHPEYVVVVEFRSLSPDLAAVNKDWRRKQFPNSRVTLANFMQKRWPGTEEAVEMVIIASGFVGADLARKAELYFFLLYGRSP